MCIRDRALGIDPPMQDLMRRRPRDPKLSIFAGLKGWIVGITLLMSFVMVSVFNYSLMFRNLAEARSLLFVSIILFELTFVFSCRSQSQTIFHIGVTSNRYLVPAVMSQVILLFVIMYTPGIGPLFELFPMPLKDWLVAAVAGISGFVLAETAKAVAGTFHR